MLSDRPKICDRASLNCSEAGVMATNSDGQITDFLEKPAAPQLGIFARDFVSLVKPATLRLKRLSTQSKSCFRLPRTHES